MNDNPKKRILIIEDESHIAEGLKLNLSLQGYEVEVADNGNAGLKTWKAWQPDLIVLDQNLPGMDGLDVCRQLRRESDVPIIMLTAKHGEDSELDGLRSGADDYITKPFSFEEVLARINATLRRSQSNINTLPLLAPLIVADYIAHCHANLYDLEF